MIFDFLFVIEVFYCFFQIYVVPPYRTPRPFWYQRNFTEAARMLTDFPESFTKDLSLAPSPDLSLSDFTPDGRISNSHVRGGVIRDLIDWVENSRLSQIADLQAPDEGGLPYAQEPLFSLSGDVQRHDVLINSLIEDVASLTSRLDLSSARLADERDGRVNCDLENRVVFHGLPSIAFDSREALQPAAIKNIKDCLSKVFGSYEIDVQHVLYFGSDRPVYEAILPTSSASAALRQKFGKLPLKRRQDLKIRISNSITPGTRVRLAIFRVRILPYVLEIFVSFVYFIFIFRLFGDSCLNPSVCTMLLLFCNILIFLSSVCVPLSRPCTPLVCSES